MIGSGHLSRQVRYFPDGGGQKEPDSRTQEYLLVKRQLNFWLRKVCLRRKDATRAKTRGHQNGVGPVEGSVESVVSLDIMPKHAQMLKILMENPIPIVLYVYSLFWCWYTDLKLALYGKWATL